MRPEYNLHLSGILQIAIKELHQANIPNSEFEAEMILAHLLKIPKNELHFSNILINNTIRTEFLSLIDKRKKHYPLQYILEEWEFWSLPLRIPEGVFIPRPETETLIEVALELKENNINTIIDLGTGSGNIAIALAKEYSQIQVFASDISMKALNATRYNAQLNNAQSRIHCIQSDFLSAFNPDVWESPLLIVSNPPYIGLHELHLLQDEIKCYEPTASYLADEGGMECYHRIFCQLDSWHSSPLYLLFEIAPKLFNRLINISKQHGFTIQSQRNDLNGQLRALLFKR